METQEKESQKESFELRCDSSRCWKCSDEVCEVCEKRDEDLIFAAGL